MSKINPKILIIPLFIGFSFVYYYSFIKAEDTLSSRLLGKILLQVEDNGEAWYVNPLTRERHFMGRPDDAFKLMKTYGHGISNSDLKKIKIAEFASSGVDTDGDGLNDLLEDAIGTSKTSNDTDNDSYNDKSEIKDGYDPLGKGKYEFDEALAKKMSGLILIQAEQNGEAWYINPENNQRYFLGRPSDAFAIMKQTGLGIKNSDLAKISEYSIKTNDTIQNNVSYASDSKKKYSDQANSYSFNYPNDWKINKVTGKSEVIFLNNYEDDIIKEKKAMITVAFIKTPENIDLNQFSIASKDGAQKITTNVDKINEYQALSEIFEYEKVASKETTTFVKLNDKEMLMLTLFSAGSHESHDRVFSEILRSVVKN